MFTSPIPIPLFEPDKSPYLFRAGDNLVNCFPISDGWGPMPSFIDVSDALPGTCLGAVYIKDAGNTITIIAGTATNLYRLDTSTSPYSWTEVSKATDAYNVPPGDLWDFTVFGDFLIAHSLGDQPQVIDLTGTGTFADLPDAPIAKRSWLSGDHLVFGWLSGEPNTVRWSGINDHTFWTVGRKGADVQTFPDGDGVAGGIGDQQGSIILFREKIRRMQFAPATGFQFTFADINGARGTIAPYSIVEIADGDFVYLSEDGFCRGVQGAPIGAERVDRWFNEMIDLDFLYDVRGIKDPFARVAWWRFQKEDGTAALIGYNWLLDRWCYSDQDIQHAASMASPGITLAGVDLLFASAGEMNVPFGSRIFSGGRPVLAVFTPENKLAFVTGSPLQAIFRTPLLELSPNQRTFVRGFRVEADTSAITGRIGAADHFGDASVYTASLTPSARGKALQDRVSARLHSFEVTIPAGTDWSVITSIRVDASPEGDL